MTPKNNILIVDDRQGNILSMEALLEDLDVNIISATSGNEALALLFQHDFTLVILDVQMPEMDGFETAELMRGRENTKNIPIIFVTAISKDHEHIFKGYTAGAVDYLFKPIDQPLILISKVKIFCELYNQKQLIETQLLELAEKNRLLQKHINEIKILRGIIPICATCKKIRDDQGYWNQLESYIHNHAEVEFTHGICPDCAEKVLAELRSLSSPQGHQTTDEENSKPSSVHNKVAGDGKDNESL